MPLIATPANPLPGADICAKSDILYCTAPDHVVLRAALFRPTKVECGTIIIAQGRAEWIEKYFPTIGAFLERGFVVIAFDWRGQGGSQRLTKNRRKGYVADFADYRRDLETVLATIAKRLEERGKAPLPEPLYGLGHSMGGLVLLQVAAARRDLFARLILTAPMLRIAGLRLERFGYFYAGLSTRLGFGKAYVPFGIGGKGIGGKNFAFHHRPFTGKVLTSDRAEYDRIRTTTDTAPRLALGAPTLGWVSAANKAMRHAFSPAFGMQVATPVLFVCGSLDGVVDNFAIERFARGLKLAHIIRLAGSSHDIMCEKPTIRDQFWCACDAFFKPRDALPAHQESDEQQRANQFAMPATNAV